MDLCECMIKNIPHAFLQLVNEYINRGTARGTVYVGEHEIVVYIFDDEYPCAFGHGHIYLNAGVKVDILEVLGVDCIPVRLYYMFLHEYEHARQYYAGEKMYTEHPMRNYRAYYEHASEKKAWEASDKWLRSALLYCKRLHHEKHK